MTDVAGSALRLAFVAATLAAVAPAAAIAQTDFPRRAVKFVVPVPPGNMLELDAAHHRREALGALEPAGDRREPSRRRVEPRHRGGVQVGA